MSRTPRARRAADLRRRYDNNLKDHVILSRHVADEGHASFAVGRPGDSAFMAEVALLSFGTVLVHGDVDTVIFARCSYKGWRQKLSWLADTNYDYAEEKAAIGSGCSGMARCVETAIAVSDIAYHRRQLDLDKETAREARDLCLDGDVHSANSLIYEKTGDFEICDLGQCTAPRVFMAQAVLSKLNALLIAEEAGATVAAPLDALESKL